MVGLSSGLLRRNKVSGEVMMEKWPPIPEREALQMISFHPGNKGQTELEPRAMFDIIVKREQRSTSQYLVN
ncbi:hypothetical protein PanWU01x14_047230 [Parasponia andersonii]|uniref:Uncharacterized protein n=1 Tax=Parasponia andersonii TaxID=3476 RepID=A0A2P5DP04_PARAD|nr:hypothetical protein PanWU01x14_047230 [Parasponia andersonii]